VDISWLARRWLLLAAFLLPPGAGAIYVPVNNESAPWFWVRVMDGVGLAPNATITVQLSAAVPAPNAFVVLLSESQLLAIAPYLLRKGPPYLSSSYLPCAWRASLAGTVNATFRLEAGAMSRYYFGVMQASFGAARGLFGEVGYVNPGGDQLPVQQWNVPGVILFMALAFLGSGLVLFILCVLRRRGRTRLHAMLLGTILVKCWVLLLIRHDLSTLRRTGRQSVVRQATWQLLRQVQSIMEVMLFYLVGLGYKVVRSHLRQSEQVFAATITLTSLCLGSLEVACSTFVGCSNQSYLLTQFTLHSICFLVIIIAVNFNIFTLQRQISEALATPETGALYAKHRAYCWFRGFFLYYVVIPSVTNFFALHVVSWTELWVIVLVREGSLWVIYTGVFWLFRPGPKHLRVFELAVMESSESDSDGDG